MDLKLSDHFTNKQFKKAFMISSFHRYKYPCLFTCSEKLIFEMADRMAEDGFKDAGYEFVSIDVSTYHVTYYKA